MSLFFLNAYDLSKLSDNKSNKVSKGSVSRN